MNNLSANQQYKLSGSALPFTEWISREKAKGNVIPKMGVTDVFEKEMSKIARFPEDSLDVPKSKTSKTILGLNKNILMLSALIVISAIAYKVYKKNK